MAEGFAAIPTWMFREHQRVSVWGVMVFGALATRAGLRGNFPGQATLAAEARCSERKVRDALRELEELGVVERVRRTSKLGYRQADGYRLMDRPLDEDESLAAQDAGRDDSYRQETTEPTGTSEQITPLIEVDSSEVDNPQTPTGGQELKPASRALDEVERAFDSAFQNFYEIYPRKVGRTAARGAFAKAARRAGGYEVIVDGARRFASDPNLPEKQFIPHPTTWLNRGGWEDEPLPPRAPWRGSAAEEMAAEFFQWNNDEDGGEGRALST